MGRSSLLFIVVSLSSLGSLIQTFSNNDTADSSASELIFHSGNSSGSLEGSGHSVDSTASQKLIIPLKSEGPGSGSTLTPTPALRPHHSGANDQGAQAANASITGYTDSSVHKTSEEALLEDSHEEELKESHISTVNDDFLDGK